MNLQTRKKRNRVCAAIFHFFFSVSFLSLLGHFAFSVLNRSLDKRGNVCGNSLDRSRWMTFKWRCYFLTEMLTFDAARVACNSHGTSLIDVFSHGRLDSRDVMVIFGVRASWVNVRYNGSEWLHGELEEAVDETEKKHLPPKREYHTKRCGYMDNGVVKETSCTKTQRALCVKSLG
ncbi:C-type lectin-like IEV/EEV glycoprotein [Western grey kangaroopox virus]|uniref:C-type lectin-like IEV/EEV glycoprotein n=1 Tax=Western grey kangaroopox virus TaxID=1566307 RepID=A0A2C9DSU3_9POXV|nr:C-type lectin-like IEV/EEV glycoprotein [Western grey kangaroopox virus]ATI21076.1 C-type lectin-like IEV/EEV glycoprotein [Western grey kangaroopox virus]